MNDTQDDWGPRSLWAAVLLQAIRDTKAEPSPHAVRRAAERDPVSSAFVQQIERARFDAVEWFAALDYCIGSFTWICEILDLDRATIRARVLCTALDSAGIPPAS